MAYFKWQALDFDLKYHDGVMECDRFELVIIELAKKNLVPKLVTVVEYPEYQRLRQAEAQLRKLHAHLPKPPPLPQPPTRLEINWLAVLGAAAVLALLLLIYLASR